jgi:hypothetical protein
MSDTGRKSLGDLWSESPGLDTAAAITIAGGYGWLRVRHGIDVLSTLDEEARRASYGVLAGVAGGIFALIFAAISIFLGLASGERIRVLRVRHGDLITRTMFAMIRALGLVTLVALVAVVGDQPGPLDLWVRWCVYLAFVIGTLRSIRLVWLFGTILAIDQRDKERGTVPGPAVPFRKPEDPKVSNG